MNGWRPELTAATADSDALTRPGLRVVPPPAAHARAGRGGFSRGRVRTLFAADIAAILISLAATYVLAEQIGPPAVIGPTWLFVALVPVITVAGIQFGSLLAGAVVTEKVFARPGIGTLLLEAISQRDYRVVQGCTLVIAISYVTVNLLVDLAYGLADPRIRVQ